MAKVSISPRANSYRNNAPPRLAKRFDQEDRQKCHYPSCGGLGALPPGLGAAIVAVISIRCARELRAARTTVTGVRRRTVATPGTKSESPLKIIWWSQRSNSYLEYRRATVGTQTVELRPSFLTASDTGIYILPGDLPTPALAVLAQLLYQQGKPCSVLDGS
jgi:hypothetical protein